MNTSFHRAYGILALFAFVAAVVTGFAIIGSPGTRRLERLDERRIDDLRAIVREIQRRVEDPNRTEVLKQPLPGSLDDVAQNAQVQKLALEDPDTGAPYRYEVLSETSYALEAIFETVRDSKRLPFWNHPVGVHRFVIDALSPPPN